MTQETMTPETTLAVLHTQLTAILATTPPGHPSALAVASYVGAMYARTKAYYAGDEAAIRALQDAPLPVSLPPHAPHGPHHVLFDGIPGNALSTASTPSLDHGLSPLAPEFAPRGRPCPPRFQQQYYQYHVPQYPFQGIPPPYAYQYQPYQPYQPYPPYQQNHHQQQFLQPQQYQHQPQHQQYQYQQQQQHQPYQPQPHQPFTHFSTGHARRRRRRSADSSRES